MYDLQLWMSPTLCYLLNAPPSYSRHKDKTFVFIEILDHIWITKNAFMVCFFASQSLKACFQYTIPPTAAMLGLLSLVDHYPREYRLQHSPNLEDVGL